MKQFAAILFTSLALVAGLAQVVCVNDLGGPVSVIDPRLAFGLPRNGLKALYTFGPDPTLVPGARWFQVGWNLLLWSEDLTKSVWTGGATVDDVTHLTFTAQYNNKYQYIPTLGGVTYTFYFRGRNVSGNTNLYWYTVNSASGNLHSLSVANEVADYAISVLGRSGGGSVGFGWQDRNASGWGQLEVLRSAVIPGSHTAAECAALYQKTEAQQTFHDWSGNGHTASRGSDDEAEDTNDPQLTPSSRNLVPIDQINDLTQWIGAPGATVVDADTVTLDPGAYVYARLDLVPNTYVVGGVDADIVSGTGTVEFKITYAGGFDSDSTTGRKRLISRARGTAARKSCTFYGSGLNDADIDGVFTCTADYMPGDLETVAVYRVQIDSTGTPDTFSWSRDNSTSWVQTEVPITGGSQALDCGVSVTFGNTTGHTVGDFWLGRYIFGRPTITASASNPGPITVDITNLQVEYCASSDCQATPFTNPAEESVVQGATFDGVDDYVALPDESALKPDAFTVVAVLRMHDATDGEPVISWSATDSRPAVYARSPDDWGNQSKPLIYLNSENYCYFAETIETETWHVLAVTVPGSGQTDIEEAAFYLDGAPLTVDTAYSADSQMSKGQPWLGRAGDYYGHMDQALVAVYSRAISAAETQRSYRSIARLYWDYRSICVSGWESHCQSPPLHAKLLAPWQPDGTWALAMLPRKLGLVPLEVQ